jgi:hypothetical protein
LQTELLPLLLGRVEMDFRARGYDGGVTGHAAFGRQAWRLTRVEGEATFEALAGVLPEIGIVGMTGRIRFEGEDLAGTYRTLPASGRLQANIEDLRVALIEGRRPLGSYTLAIHAGPGKGLTANLETSSADALLIVEGEGRVVHVNETPRFAGYAAAADNAPDPVRSLLPLLGPVENGRAIIRWPRR